MNKTRFEKGITLIALVITIIVLLILAVVTIGSIKNNNIITYAQNAAKDYNEEKAKEGSMLGQYEEEISKYETGDKEEIIPAKKGKTLNDQNMQTIWQNAQNLLSQNRNSNSMKLTLKNKSEDIIKIGFISQDTGYNGIVVVEVSINNNSTKYVWQGAEYTDQYNYILDSDEVSSWCIVTEKKENNSIGMLLPLCEKIKELPMFLGEWIIYEENTTEEGKQYLSDIIVDL